MWSNSENGILGAALWGSTGVATEEAKSVNFNTLTNYLNSLKEDLSDVIYENENIFNGILVSDEQVAVSSGAFVDGPNYARSGYIPVKSGIVNVGVKSSSTIPAVLIHYALYDSNKTKLSTGQRNTLTIVQADDMYYVQIPVSQNGYFAFDVYKTYITLQLYVSQIQSPTGYVAYVSPHVKPSAVFVDNTLTAEGIPADAKVTGQKFANFDGLLIERTTTDETQLNLSWTTGKYMSKAGYVSNNDNYQYSSQIPVSKGDKLIRAGTYIFRYVTAYNNDAVVSDKGAESVNTYTVPDGVTAVIVSVTIASDYVAKQTSTKIVAPASEDAINTIRGGILTSTKDDSMSSGDSLYLCRNSIIRNNQIVFKADTSESDWSIMIAHGVVDNTFDADSYSAGFLVTPTLCKYIYGMHDGIGGTEYDSWTHELDVGARICIVIYVDDMQIVTVYLMTESGEVHHTFANQYNGRKGSIYAKVISGTFTNCILTFGCSDIKKPVWLFGDSYVSMLQERYPYWLKQLNADNCLINSYPGEGSINALKDLKELLNIGSPKYLIWALGMNDHDNTNNINTFWKECIDEILILCNERQIIPILATIPNVTHTSYNNINKNAWIKSQKYRYIDFALAIGASEEVGATWHEGWLSSDNVHPTVMGARVLAMQIIADVPELLQP